MDLVQFPEQINTILFERTNCSQTKEQKYITNEAPFVDEILGMAIVKMLDKQEQVTVMLKLKFIRNRTTLNVTNNTQQAMTFEPKDMIGILDLRSLGNYKIMQGALQ